MCGRYTLSTPMDDLVEVFDVPPVTFDHEPCYNIAPTQEAPVFGLGSTGHPDGPDALGTGAVVGR
jgi:putative SOS response-associated peptidase YedK